LTTSADVSVRHSFITNKLGVENKTAALTVSADLHNVSNHPVKGVLKADIGSDISVSQPVELAPNQEQTVRLSSDSFGPLNITNPKLWCPYQMGEPYLYPAKISFEVDGRASDSESIHFGIREVTSELTPTGGLLFKINHRNLLIRGAAWAND